jgi:hypothetical protein
MCQRKPRPYQHSLGIATVFDPERIQELAREAEERRQRRNGGTGRRAPWPRMPANKGVAMLELRPICENCGKALPPDSPEARICSYECTFCAACVEGVLQDVCPNCGGGFAPRPIRPSRNWKGDNYLGKDPASTKVKHRPVDAAAHARFAASIKTIPPRER